MLQKLSKEIRECYRHAAACKLRAQRSPDSSKQDFIDLERRWLSLARSYQLSEKLSDFTAEIRRRRK